MEFDKIFQKFKQGKWIQRESWKKDYAIQLCNLPPYPKFYTKKEYPPVLIHTTDGFLFWFGMHQQEKYFKDGLPDGHTDWVNGLQYDLFADDWMIANQTLCNKLRDTEDERRRKSFEHKPGCPCSICGEKKAAKKERK